MGFSMTLTGFPVFVLIISTLIGGAGIAGAIGNQSFNGGTNSSLPTVDCSAFSGIQGIGKSCFGVLPTNVIITCTSPNFPSTSCTILLTCSNPSSPMYCSSNVFGQTFTVLDEGNVATITNGQVSGDKNSVIFAFGTVTTQGLVFAFIGVAVAVAAVVGLNVFGSGESSEAIHILLMGGIFLGVWTFFSGLEGFIAASPASFFTQLNNSYANLGSTFYAVLSLTFMFSWVKTISRGGT